MYKAIIAIGIAVVAGLVAGCGSSSEETAEAAMTKAQFIKQADKACSEVAKKREAAAKSWRKEHPGELVTADLNKAFKEVIVPSVQEQVEALQALPAPEADKAEVARMIDTLIEANEAFQKEGARGTRQPADANFEAEARKYGLKICPQIY